MSGYSSYADASAPPPFDDGIYDGSWAPYHEQPDLAAHPPYFHAPLVSTGDADPYAYYPQAHLAVDPGQDVYASSVEMYGQPAAPLADGEAWYPERCLPSPGANAVVPSTFVWSSPDLTASVDVTSRSVTPGSTMSSPWDSYDALPVAGSGAFPTAITANLTDDLHSADAPISLNPEIPAVAAEPEAPATVVDAPVAPPRRRLARKREQKARKADDSRWHVSGPEEERQLENVEAFNAGHLIWDANAPDLPTVKVVELAQVEKTQRRTAKSASARRADSTGRDRRTQSRSHPEPAAAPASRAQTPAPPRGRRTLRAPPPPAPVTAQDAAASQDAPGPESTSAPLYRPRAYSSAPTRAPTPHAAPRAPARSQSSAPVLAHALVYKFFDETTTPAAEDHAGWPAASELGTPSDVADVPSEPFDLDRALADIGAGNGYVHEDFVATEHTPWRDQLPVAGSSLGLYFDSAYGALSSSGPAHYPASSQRYAPPAYPPPGRSSPSSVSGLPAHTYGPQPGQPSYWGTPLLSTTVSYDPYISSTPHTPYESYNATSNESYQATSNEDAPVRNRKRRVPDDGFLDYGARTYDYNTSR